MSYPSDSGNYRGGSEGTLDPTQIEETAIDFVKDLQDFVEPNSKNPAEDGLLVDDVISPEDEATINQLLGDTSAGGIFGGPEPTKEQVEEHAKLRADARNYSALNGVLDCEDAIDALALQFGRSFDVIHKHVTMEWNKALVWQEENAEGTSEIPVYTPEYLQTLNPVRFMEYGRQEIDKGIALLREVLRRP